MSSVQSLTLIESNVSILLEFVAEMQFCKDKSTSSSLIVVNHSFAPRCLTYVFSGFFNIVTVFFYISLNHRSDSLFTQIKTLYILNFSFYYRYCVLNMA